MGKMSIRISSKLKMIIINCISTINYDELDLRENIIFMWKDNIIVGTITIIPTIEYEFEFVSDTGYQYFLNYENFKKYVEKNNLVK